MSVDVPSGYIEFTDPPLRIVSAPPVTTILVRDVIQLTATGPYERGECDGKVLRIRDDFGQEFTHVLGELDEETMTYAARWSD